MTLRLPGILSVAVVALLGAVGVWLDEPANALWRVAAALLAIGLLTEYVIARALPLRAYVYPDGAMHLGRSCRWRLELQNASHRQVEVRFAAKPPGAFAGSVDDVVASLAPGERSSAHVVQTAERLGEWRWPPQPVEVRGLMRLAAWIRTVPARKPVPPDASDALDASEIHTVVSRVEPDLLGGAARRVALADHGVRATPRRSAIGTEFYGLRDYELGDAPAMIHWKATARTGRVVVREAELEQQLLVYFVIDCGRHAGLRLGRLTVAGHAVNLAARMSELADHAGDRYGVLCYSDQPGAQLAPGRGPRHQHSFRQLLADVETQQSESNPLTAVLTLQRLLPQRALILFFCHLDAAGSDDQLIRAIRLLRPKHLPMLVALRDPELLRARRDAVEDRDSLFARLAIEEHRRGVARSRERLERLGAIVVEATPDQVEAQVFDRYRSLRSQRQV